MKRSNSLALALCLIALIGGLTSPQFSLPLLSNLTEAFENVSLSTDKEIYYLNETINITVKVSSNVTTNLTVEDPLQGIYSTLGGGFFSHTYTPVFLGNYSVSAFYSLGNMTGNASVCFTVLQSPVENATNETLSNETQPPENLTFSPLDSAFLSTDKALYFLNKTVRVQITAPENTTTNLTIEDPLGGSYSTLKENFGGFTHLYLPEFLGDYLVSARLSLENQSSNLSAFFSVTDAVELPRNVTNETVELPRNVTNETRIPENLTNETSPENVTYSPLESASLSTDKFFYYLNETVRISVKAPENTMTNLTIQNPVGEIYSTFKESFGAFTHVYIPEFMGQYLVLAQLTLQNETKELNASFEVIPENVTEREERPEITLLSNTYNCLIDCKAIVDIYIPESKLEGKVSLSKVKKPDLVSRKKRWLERGLLLDEKNFLQTEELEIWFLKTPKSEDLGDFKVEKKVDGEWKNLISNGLSPGHNLLRITGTKKPKTGENNIDWKIGLNLSGEYMEPPYAWWNSSWDYKQNISISNTAENLTNYQINISLNATPLYEAGELNSTCKDIRFIYYNSTSGTETEIYFWIENCTTNNNAILSKFWVKVPFIENNTNTTVYMYYGNPSASSASALASTFNFGSFIDTFTNETKINTTYSTDINVSEGGVKLNRTICGSGHTDNGDGTCTAVFDNPSPDGYATNGGSKDTALTFFTAGRPSTTIARGFVEWNVSSIPDGAIIVDTVFKYHGYEKTSDCHIHEMVGVRPSTGSGSNIYTEAGEGTVYCDPTGFPEIGTGKQVDLGSSADSNLKNQLSSDWFAIGIQSDSESSGYYCRVYTEEYSTVDPKPTLQVNYSNAYKPTGILYSVTIPENSSQRSAVGAQLSWNDNEPTNTDIKYQIEYYNGTSWQLIPDSDLSGNSAGFDSSPVNISTVKSQYTLIRLKATLSTTDGSVTSSVQDWNVTYYYRRYIPIEPSVIFGDEDTTKPTITIQSPQNITYNETNLLDLNVSCSDSGSGCNSSSWRFSINDGENYGFTANTTLTSKIGSNKLVVWVSDNVGNWKSSTIYFTMNYLRWEDDFTEGEGADVKNNVNISSGYVTLNLTTTGGNITSIIINPYQIASWDKFHANDNISAQGTNVTYAILNASDNSTSCTITEAQAGAGYDISSCASGLTSVRLFASLETTNLSNTPIVYEWNVSWDLTAPSKPTLNNPVNDTYVTTNHALLNWTCTDPDGDNMAAYVYGDNSTATTLINTTTGCQNGSSYTFNWTGLNQTTYYWKVACNDTILANTSDIYQFMVDLTPPETNASAVKADSSQYTFDTWTNSDYINVTLNCSDSNPGCDKTMYCIDRINACTPTLWYYRQPISISNTGGSQTDYQVEIELNSSSVGTNFNWTTDENATRFTYYNSTSGIETECPYWIESWNSTAQEATVWVKAMFLENDTNTTIYMYYGNPSASSASNGTDTFVFFDGFEGDSIDSGKWNITITNVTTSTDHAYHGSRSAKFGINQSRLEGTLEHSDNIAIRFWFYLEETPGSGQGFYPGLHGDGTKYLCPLVFEDANIWYHDGIIWTYSGKSVSIDAWKMFEFRDFNWASHTQDILYDNNFVVNNGGQYGDSDFEDEFSFYSILGSTNAAYVDLFLVLKYSSTEPTVSSFGTEESFTKIQVTQEGISYIRFRSNDTVGNLEDTKNETIKIDTTKPTITIQYPQNMTYNETNVLDLNVSCFDATSGCNSSSWRLSINDGENYSFTANTTLTSKIGSNKLVVWASDNIVNWNSSTVYYTVNSSMWEDDLTEGEGIAGRNNINVSNGDITLNLTTASANLTSIEITPYSIYSIRGWEKFYANDNISAQGTNVTYSILNASDNSTKCTITEAQAGAGYDISSCASGLTSIRLFATLTTTNASNTPILYDWNVSWNPDGTPPTTYASAVKNDSSSYTFNTWANSNYLNITLNCHDGSGVGCNTTLYCIDTINECTPNQSYNPEEAPIWWNTSWPYRQPISISNTGGNQTEYPLKIEINSSNVGSNFNWTTDKKAIRFTYYNSTGGIETECSYWIESWNSTAQEATIWVKATFLENNTNTTIYLYYRNPSATSASELWYNVKHLDIDSGIFNYNASLGVNNYYSRDMQHRLGVEAGSLITCILKSNGNATCYGDNYFGTVANYTGGDAIEVSAIREHACVLKSNGNTDCWGYNTSGESADYTGGDAMGVVVGGSHTCVLRSNGNVTCYGYNNYGQSANYSGGDAIGVSAGGDHTCVLRSNGNVTCYGRDNYGQSANYSGGDAIGVSAEDYHTCVLRSNGNVTCYGYNNYGQSANYSGGDAIGVSAGGDHTCVLRSNGNVTCYGYNNYGQSANYSGGDAIGVSAGGGHTCALNSNDNVICYGDNGDGESANYTGGDAKNPFRGYTSPEPTVSPSGLEEASTKIQIATEEGISYIRFRSNDTIGNLEDTQSEIIKIDFQIPAITIQSPQNITYNDTNLLDLNVSCSDSGSECNTSSWRLSINDGENYSFTANTTVASKIGSNKLVVWVSDNAGKWNSSTVYYGVYSRVWEDNLTEGEGTSKRDNATVSFGNVKLDIASSVVTDSFTDENKIASKEYIEVVSNQSKLDRTRVAAIYNTYFADNYQHNGNLGGRSGADSLCAAHKPDHLSSDCDKLHAFLSVNSGDEIRDMPSNYGYNSNAPIYWWCDDDEDYGYNLLANNWTDMLDGSINMNEKTGCCYNMNTASFSGTKSDGSLWSDYNCNGWTSTTGMNNGGGWSSYTDGSWLYYSMGFCANDDPLRCISSCPKDYYLQGNLTSTNLLSGQSVLSIDSFTYNVSSLPNGTSLKAQFSQDNSTWCNSTNSSVGWETLLQGSNTIDLSALNWSGANFYYRMKFETNNTNLTPVLDEINVFYSEYYSSAEIASIAITPSPVAAWIRFYANDNISAQGTNVTYSILNASDNSTKCTITEAQAVAGYNIRTCAFNLTSIRLFATLTTTNTLNTPLVYYWNVSWDPTAPSKPTLNSPENGSYTNKNYSLLNWTCIDIDGDTMTAYVYGDNSTATTLINTTTNCKSGSPYTFNWTGLNETTYYWKVVCNDSILENTSDVYQFMVDLTPPETNASAVKTDSFPYTFDTWTNSAYVNVTLSCYDSGSGCNVTLYCTNTSNSCYPNVTYSAPVQISTEGTTYIRFRSNDTLGNLEDIKNETIKIDTVAPTTVTIQSPGNVTYNVTNLLDLNVTCYDSLSGCDQSNWRLSLNDMQNFTFAANTTLTSNIGSNKLRVWVSDLAGNWNTSTVYFTVNAPGWEDDLTEGEGSDVRNNVNMSSGDVLLNLTTAGGNLTSLTITPTGTASWNIFYANDTLAQGTNITYAILDSSNNTLCTITEAQAGSGFDLYSNCPKANSQRSVRLFANLTTTNISNTPELHYWNLSWKNESFGNYFNITIQNETEEPKIGVEVLVYESGSGSLICGGNTAANGRLACILNKSINSYNIKLEKGVNMHSAPMHGNNPILLYYTGTTLANLTVNLIDENGNPAENETVTVKNSTDDVTVCQGKTNEQGQLICEVNVEYSYDVNTSYGVNMYDIQVPNNVTVLNYTTELSLGNLSVTLKNYTGDLMANKTLRIYEAGTSKKVCGGNTSSTGEIKCGLDTLKNYDIKVNETYGYASTLIPRSLLVIEAESCSSFPCIVTVPELGEDQYPIKIPENQSIEIYACINTDCSEQGDAVYHMRDSDGDGMEDTVILEASEGKYVITTHKLGALVITEPKKNSRNRSDVDITVIAPDDTVKVVFKIMNGSSSYAVNGSAGETNDTTPPYKQIWETGNFADGTYNVTAQGYDINGMLLAEDTIENITVDNTAPTLSDPQPSADQDSRRFTASINTSEECTCRYAFEDVEYEGMGYGLSETSENYHSAKVTVDEEGDYTIYFACKDLAGNTGKDNTVEFAVVKEQVTGPTIKVSGIEEDYKQGSNVTIYASMTSSLSQPVDAGSYCNVTIKHWNGTAMKYDLQDATMTKISTGWYYYTYHIDENADTGTYGVLVEGDPEDTDTQAASGFHVAEWTRTLEQINETVEKIWATLKRTNQSVVKNETVNSWTLNSSSNIEIEYNITIPLKEGYTVNDYLPVRWNFWFIESEGDCVDQNPHSRGVTPQCNPLVAEALGRGNSSLQVNVTLRPALDIGNYTVIRELEIDPNQVWISYGQEPIGKIQVFERESTARVSVERTETKERKTMQTTTTTTFRKPEITGKAVKTEEENRTPWTLITSLTIVIALVIYAVIRTRAQPEEEREVKWYER